MPNPSLAQPGEGRTTALAAALRRVIEADGPVPIGHWMAAANAHYYATRDPLGAAGDFTTAPEISQMFGELVGVWLLDLWLRAGRPAGVRFVELGPGRGTLAADALRAMRSGGLAPPVHFVETSPALRAKQAEAVPGAAWHDSLADLPDDGPLLLVANEFFDALPVRQLIRATDGWRERMVAAVGELFVPAAGGRPLDRIVPDHLREVAPGSVIETSPASVAIAREIARRLRDGGGAALLIDYGYEGPMLGDTLQAVRGHARANPFEDPGEADLTAHVDFGTLGVAARAEGVHVLGTVGQGAWLQAMGVEQRAAALAAGAPDKAGEIDAARQRLTTPDQMGELFRVLALVAPGWPMPAGFA